MAERTHLSIGEVLSLLREEFPDVTISKIRFLESQGLVDPERTPSGYRKFYDQDVERLRWILRQQRENFLPLKIIRGRLTEQGEELDEVDVAGTPDGMPAGAEAIATGVETPARQRQEMLEAASSAHPAAGNRPRGSGTGDPEPGREEVTAGAEPRASTAGNPAPAAAPGQGPPASQGPPAGQAVAGSQGPPAGQAGASSQGPPAGQAVPASQGEQARPGTGVATTPGPAPGSSSGPPPAAPTAAASIPGAGSNAGGRLTSSHAGRGGPSTEAGLRQTARSRAAPSQRAAPGDEAETLSAEELAEACGGTVAMVTDLQQYGLITARVVVGGTPYFDAAARSTWPGRPPASREYGVEARHLRAWRNAADREAGIFEQVIVPLLRQRNPEARRRAADTLAELAALGGDLRRALVDQALRQIR